MRTGWTVGVLSVAWIGLHMLFGIAAHAEAAPAPRCSVPVPPGYAAQELPSALRAQLLAQMEAVARWSGEPTVRTYLHGSLLAPKGVFVVLQGDVHPSVRHQSLDQTTHRVAALRASPRSLYRVERKTLATGQGYLDLGTHLEASLGLPARELRMLYVPRPDDRMLVVMWQGETASVALWEDVRNGLKLRDQATRMERLVTWGGLALLGLILLGIVAQRLLAARREGRPVSFGEAERAADPTPGGGVDAFAVGPPAGMTQHATQAQAHALPGLSSTLRDSP